MRKDDKPDLRTMWRAKKTLRTVRRIGPLHGKTFRTVRREFNHVRSKKNVERKKSSHSAERVEPYVESWQTLRRVR
ncbi:Hypothetical predicted protein, partial [Olea europaea subsp. europaea]